MSRWRDTERRDLWRAVVVGEFHPEASALEYLRAHSLADDGRVVTDA